MPNPKEVAEVIVNGYSLQNWKTVNVQHRWAEAFHIFAVGTAESNPPAPRYLQMMPNIGDMVVVNLAGIRGISGPVTVRQSAMDKESHGVQIIGKSLTWQMAKSSALTQTGNFNGQTLTAIANNLAGQVGVTVKEIGTVDATPFDDAQHSPGEPSIDYLEHLARARGTIVGSDSEGNLLLIGPHNDTDEGDALVEGDNILRINVLWSNETVYANILAVAQMTGSNEAFGEEVSRLSARYPGNDPNPSNLVVPQEHPDTKDMVSLRARFEAQWHNGSELTVLITVQGWLRKNGDLWRVGNIYWVTAPSHMLDGIGLKAKVVTFEQSDSEGTTTTLELVLPWFINGMLLQANWPAAPALPGQQ